MMKYADRKELAKRQRRLTQTIHFRLTALANAFEIMDEREIIRQFVLCPPGAVLNCIFMVVSELREAMKTSSEDTGEAMKEASKPHGQG